MAIEDWVLGDDPPDDTVDIECEEIIHETDKALLVRVEGEEVWLPLSQVEAIHHGAEPCVTVTRWIAAKKGLL